jgi:hypothetical protein
MTLSSLNKPCIIVDSPALMGETYIRSRVSDRPIFVLNSRILHVAEGTETLFQIRVLLNNMVAGSWNLSATGGQALRDSAGAIPFKLNLPMVLVGAYNLVLELIDVVANRAVARTRRTFGVVLRRPRDPEERPPKPPRPFHRRPRPRLLATDPAASTASDRPGGLIHSESDRSCLKRSSSPSWPLESTGESDPLRPPPAGGGRPPPVLSRRKLPRAASRPHEPAAGGLLGPDGVLGPFNGVKGAPPVADGGAGLFSLWQFGEAFSADREEGPGCAGPSVAP